MSTMTQAPQSIRVIKPHISLNVSDIQQSIEFYSKMFQTQPVKIREGYVKFDLQVPSLNLALNQNSLGAPGATSLTWAFRSSAVQMSPI
ncbi:MAG: VOC family protein [Leptospiraceae bacterium]|nr:VOC family protein [Leptospiraceae bacterium]